MARSETTSLFIDDVIRLGAAATLFGAVLLGPNMLIALEKPLEKLCRHLDQKDQALVRARELKRIISYMKAQGYLVGEYEHGLQLTDKARKRLLRRDSEQLRAKPQKVWDRVWRIVIYDIPNTQAAQRQAIRLRLRQYGCFHLQRSVLITPFPCFDDLTTLAAQYNVEEYLTFFETSNLANDTVLVKRFAKKYPETSFE